MGKKTPARLSHCFDFPYFDAKDAPDAAEPRRSASLEGGGSLAIAAMQSGNEEKRGKKTPTLDSSEERGEVRERERALPSIAARRPLVHPHSTDLIVLSSSRPLPFFLLSSSSPKQRTCRPPSASTPAARPRPRRPAARPPGPPSPRSPGPSPPRLLFARRRRRRLPPRSLPPPRASARRASPPGPSSPGESPRILAL